jgi:hypothetical protein
MMEASDRLRVSDAAVIARALQVRGLFYDRLLTLLDQLIPQRYSVQTTTRLHATLPALLRTGFVRPIEGELWPVVFLTAVDITLLLALQITPERVAGLGTMLKGPQRLKHRHWEDWWGWETNLAGVHPNFFELSAAEQDDAMVAWYREGLEWLANSGLMRRR